MAKAPKEISDTQFERMLKNLSRLSGNQVDKLWERLRLEIRRTYYNQGLEGAVKTLDSLFTPAMSGKQLIEALRKKTWQALGTKKKAKKPVKKAEPKTA